jgi:molybdopterin-guanine dinucleotide biosynthesis protein A
VSDPQLRNPRHVGAVLVGGRSTRFGSPKALVEVGGRSMLQRIVDEQRKVLSATALVGSANWNVGAWGLPVLSDILAANGPISGIHAALVWARTNGAAGACVNACDAPFVEQALFECLIGSSATSDAVVPRTRNPDRAQPLFGWFSCRCIAAIEGAARDGDHALHRLLDRLERVTFLAAEDLPLRRPSTMVFLNVNTPVDLHAARRFVEEFPDE